MHFQHQFIKQLRCCLLLALLVCAMLHSHAQSNPPAGYSFGDVEVLPDKVSDGVKGLALRFNLRTKDNKPTTPISSYFLECQLTDENGLPLPAATGAVGNTNNAAQCRDSIALAAGALDPKESHILFIPYCAMSLNAGPNHIKIRLILAEQKSRQLIATTDPIDVRFEKPPMKLYRMKVDRIESYVTDVDGETWDYKFLNARDIYPELIWSLRRGNQNVFESPKQKNDTIFIGESGDRSQWIWLSDGDRIHYYVHDFDLLGFSDLVGSLPIDVWQSGFRSGATVDLSFERVRHADVKQEAIVAPKVAITNFEVIEQDQLNGLTGVRVKCDYAIQNGIAGAKYYLALQLRDLKGNAMPNRLIILGPGAIPFSDDVVELIAEQSSLELFVPHYAMPVGLLSQARLQLIAGVVLDQQPIVLSRVLRPIIGGDQAIADMVYGQWKVGIEDRAGQSGLQIELDYELPASYFQELSRKTEIVIQPTIEASWGLIANQDFEVIGPERSGWNGNGLVLNAANRKGSLHLFLPFSHCPPGGGETQLVADYATVMHHDGRDIALGDVHKASVVDLPPLRMLALGLREAAVARRYWLLSHPSMYWELQCGGKVLVKSDVIPEERNARWPETIAYHGVVAPQDSVVLRVYHKGQAGDPDRLLDAWSGPVSALPGREKGNFRLPSNDLKKMVIHLEYMDRDKNDNGPR